MELEHDDECNHVFKESAPQCANGARRAAQRIEVCLLCGIERIISTYVDTDAEWRNFKERGDISKSRCVYRHKYDRDDEDLAAAADDISQQAISTMLKVLNIPEDFAPKIEDLYERVVKGDIIRYPFNRSLLFVCTYMTYKTNNRFLEYGKLQKTFDVNKKQVSAALKFFNLKLKLNKITFDTKPCVTIEQYLTQICDDLDLRAHIPNVLEDVTALYNSISKLSEVVNHSIQKTAAIAIIKYYIKVNHDRKRPLLAQMSKRYSVSENSIQKIEKDIGHVLGVPSTCVRPPPSDGAPRKKKRSGSHKARPRTDAMSTRATCTDERVQL